MIKGLGGQIAGRDRDAQDHAGGGTAAAGVIQRWRRYGAHEQIVDRQGDSSDLCFVVEGRVRVVNYSASGREITLDDIVAGEYFGELAAIDGQPRSANVLTLTACTIASLPRQQFRDMIETHPKIGFLVMERLASMVRHSTERIVV